MTETRVSLAGGILGERLHARRDISKYGVAVADGENLYVQKEGPLSNRSGTVMVAEVGAGAHKLVSFKFDADEQYVLAFGDQTMRVVKTGALGFVQSSGADYTLTTPYLAADVADLRLMQKGDIAYVTHPGYAVRKLTRLADDSWTLAVATFAPEAAAPTSPAAVFSGASGSAPQNSFYRVSTISEAGEESLPTSPFQAGAAATLGTNTLSWTAAAGASYYVVYKLENGFYGYIGKTETTGFVDSGIDADTADAPLTNRNPFASAGQFPGVSVRYQQRLLYANSLDEPLKVYASQPGSLDNFSFSTPQVADDSFDLEIDAQIQGEIRHLVNLGGLFALTSEAVVEIRPTDGRVAQPGQMEAVVRLRIGASPVEPLEIVDHILFVEDSGQTIQSIRRDDVYVEKVVPTERSIMAPDLFEGRSVARMAYARAPDSIVACVFDDGSCAVMTYVPEHDAWGWMRWTSAAGALFRDVVAIREGGRDVLYFSVERTIDGGQVVYIEKLAARVDDPTRVGEAIFVDSAVAFDRTASTTVTGLAHLEGEMVAGIVDGFVVRNLTVSSGSVTLPFAGSRGAIGLEMEMWVQTLPPVRGRVRVKGVPTVYLDVYRTSTVKVGKSLTEMAKRFPPPMVQFNQSALLRSGVLEVPVATDYGREAQIYIAGEDPLPFTLRAYELDIVSGGSS